jgi:glutamate N-acetyltransferase/amino-acid N-acetyltransferase
MTEHSPSQTAYEWIDQGGITAPRGWQAAGVSCGIRNSRRPDLALVLSDTPCAAAALFTTNAVTSAHIQYARPLLERNPTGMRAVVVNSGSANACTGAAGVEATATVARATEETLGLPTDSTFVMSTGVIGLPLPVEKIVPGIAQAAQELGPAGALNAARATMTTDIRPKQGAVRVALPGGGVCTIGGMAKGSGMIHPNMATMLCTLTTDATLSPELLRAALRHAADRSFHCISVDGDTSTNDTLLALANGQAGLPQISSLDTPDGQAFLAGLTALCQYLAREVARDGEGATRFVTIQVRGAASDTDAHRAAMTVARSPLVKTAIFGADPNWGRIVCALGYSEVALDPARLRLSFGEMQVFANGVPLAFDEQAAHKLLSEPDVLIDADLGLGSGSAVAWTCDFSYDYIKINAEYRS